MATEGPTVTEGLTAMRDKLPFFAALIGVLVGAAVGRSFLGVVIGTTIGALSMGLFLGLSVYLWQRKQHGEGG